jgi:hypothetical protein
MTDLSGSLKPASTLAAERISGERLRLVQLAAEGISKGWLRLVQLAAERISNEWLQLVTHLLHVDALRRHARRRGLRHAARRGQRLGELAVQVVPGLRACGSGVSSTRGPPSSCPGGSSQELEGFEWRKKLH